MSHSSRLAGRETAEGCCTDLVSALGLVELALEEAAMDAVSLVGCRVDFVAEEVIVAVFVAAVAAEILAADCVVGSSGSFASAEAGHQQLAFH